MSTAALLILTLSRATNWAPWPRSPAWGGWPPCTHGAGPEHCLPLAIPPRHAATRSPSRGRRAHGTQATPAGERRCRRGRAASPVPRWVLVEARALRSLPPPLPGAHVGAVRPAARLPAAPQALAVRWWLSALLRRLRPALAPALGAPVLPLWLPLLWGGGVCVSWALPPLPPPPPRRGGRLLRLRALPPRLRRALPLPLFAQAPGRLIGLGRLVCRGPEAPIDLRQRGRGEGVLWACCPERLGATGHCHRVEAEGGLQMAG